MHVQGCFGCETLLVCPRHGRRDAPREPAPVDPLDAAMAAAPEVEWLTPAQRAESDAALARHHTHGTAAPLIARAVNLVGRLLWCPDVEAPAALREEALLLEEELAAFERGYRAAHGPEARCPTVRAWYLLRVLREHATLLRGPVQP